MYDHLIHNWRNVKLSKNKSNNKKGSRSKQKWVINIIFLSILICGSVTLLSDTLLRKVNMLVAFIILISIILIGIVFDTIGIAVTAADETPFNSMASKRIAEGNVGVKMIKNADKVSNFCNDVIGDICGIVSGSVGILIAQKVRVYLPSVNVTMISAFIGAVIASITIGGKAIGKGIGMKNSHDIIYKVAKIICTLKKIVSKRDR
ncbi:hypothetical protein ACFIJ5_11065 [Haloimpatiens sp. FM7330]|uniref:hypothetical protein n=1 Tax=Haloimpatiens sp. FM7330 TaxID=3298610 RepID=UPI00363F4E22